MADPDKLQQLFINLLTNALDASPNGAEIRITSGDEPLFPAEERPEITRGKVAEPSLAIHILDQGKGLASDQLNHVFEPFFSTKARDQGTGLGSRLWRRSCGRIGVRLICSLSSDTERR